MVRKITEIVGFVGKTNNFHDWLTENVGKTNNFHRPPPSGTHVLVFRLLRDKSRPRYRGGVYHMYRCIFIFIFMYENLL